MERDKISKPVEQEVSILENYRETRSLYIFADIRGFGSWGKQYPQEIKQLLEIEYSLARRFFDGSRKKIHRKTLVKFVGDGFFAANEVGDKTSIALIEAVKESADDILDFVGYFNKAVSNTPLHDKHDIGVGFGMSFGIGYRFNLKGFGTDYVGVQVNLASRLCSEARPSELVLENDLGEYAKEAFRERLNTLQIEQDHITIKEIDNFPVYRVQRLYEELKKPGRYVGLNKMVATIKKGKKASTTKSKQESISSQEEEQIYNALRIHILPGMKDVSLYLTSRPIAATNQRFRSLFWKLPNHVIAMGIGFGLWDRKGNLTKEGYQLVTSMD